MKKILLFIVFIICFIKGFSQTQHSVVFEPFDNTGWSNRLLPTLVHLPASYNASSPTGYPLIIFLHGAGEAGLQDGSQVSKIYNSSSAGGPAYFIEHSQWPDSFRVGGTGPWLAPVIASPQAPGWSTNGDQVQYIIRYMFNNYNIDTTRLYITGLSAGGEGVINYAGHTIDNSSTATIYSPILNRCAAMVPMSQANSENTIKAARAVADSVRAWGFGSDPADIHGTATKNQMTYMNNIVSGIARYTNYSGGHCCWNNFYNPTYKENINGTNMNIYEWMFQYSRTVSVSPVVTLSSNVTLTLPTNSTSVTSTINPGQNATITNYSWTKTSGPTTYTINSPSSANTVISGLVAGDYVFRLTVTNSNSYTGYNEISISVKDYAPTLTVNSPTITLPTSTAALTSTPTTNYSIASREWTKFKIPSQPTYILDMVGSSTIAGNGSSTYDSSIVGRSYKFYTTTWGLATIIQHGTPGATIFDFNYATELATNPDVMLVDYPSNGYSVNEGHTVTEICDKYREIRDSLTSLGIKVFFVGTQPRTDYTSESRNRLKEINDSLRITLGSLFIDWFTITADPNNDYIIKSEFQVTGDNIHQNDLAHRYYYEAFIAKSPFNSLISSSNSISSPTSQNTNVTGLTAGTWYFQHSFLDSRGLAATAISTVTVNSSGVNSPPVANAGSDQVIVLPTSSVTLDGSSSYDPDGTIVSYLWTKLTGTGGTIVSSTSSSTDVTGLTEGTYTYQLAVTDDGSSTSYDTVQIRVDPFTLYVTKVATSEYKASWLYSDSNVYHYWFNPSTSKVELTAMDFGGVKIVDVGCGFNNTTAIDKNGRAWVSVPGSNTPSMISTDTTGGTFDSLTKIYGFFYSYIALKSDGTLWFWGNDYYNLYGVTAITQPIQISQSGKVYTKVSMGGYAITALTDNGEVWQWYKDGSLTPTQKTLPRGAVDICGSYYDFYVAIVPDVTGSQTMGYPYVWGTAYQNWGGGTALTTPTDERTLWQMSYPIKEISCNESIIAYIDSIGHLYTIGDNPYGGKGNGTELVNHAELYPTPYAWSWGRGENFEPAPPEDITPDNVTFSKVFTSNIYTYYFWATDDNNNAWFWGRRKSFVGGDGISHDNEDPYPNAYDVLTPTIVNPIDNTPAVYTSGDAIYTLSAGTDQTVTSPTITLSAAGTPTTGYQIVSWLWTIESAPSNSTGIIVNPSQQTTEATNLSPGTYVFRVKMTDNNTATITSNVTITVSSRVYQRILIPYRY